MEVGTAYTAETVFRLINEALEAIYEEKKREKFDGIRRPYVTNKTSSSNNLNSPPDIYSSDSI